MRSLRALVLPALAAVAVAGCGGSSGGPKQPSPHARVAHAADVSSSEPGFKASMSLSADLGSSGQASANGSGSFSATDKSGSMSATLSLPGSAAALGQIETQLITSGDDVYIKLPSTLATVTGKQWLRLNVEQIGKTASVPGLGSVAKYAAMLSDPSQYFGYLNAISKAGIQDLGKQTIHGVETTHYRAQLDLNKLTGAVPAADRAATAQIVPALQQQTHVSQIPIDVWIDSTDHVRRIALSESSKSSQNVSFSLTTDFSDYGPQQVPAPPPGSETLKISSLAHVL
jgi:hypothetical protein